MKSSIIILIFGVASLFYSCTHQTNTNYQEKLRSVQETEHSQPINFLRAQGTYTKTLFGDNLKIHGVIKNNATVTTYKDAVVKITFFSSTKTELGTQEHTVYDFFPPQSEKAFELKIESYKDVNSIGWEVIAATPQ